MLMIMAMGLFLAGNLGFLVYMPVRSPKLDRPLTSAESLKAAPNSNSGVTRHPRLTSRGKCIVVMVTVFGAVATLVSLALGWRLASTGITQAALAAVVMVLSVDLVPVIFVALLHRTYKLVLAGHFATGIAVVVKVGAIKSWGLFYDFLDGSGQVVRGNSLRSFYTVALARAFHGDTAGDYFGVGSYVPVLYRQDKPPRNALYVSLPWEI